MFLLLCLVKTGTYYFKFECARIITFQELIVIAVIHKIIDYPTINSFAKQLKSHL